VPAERVWYSVEEATSFFGLKSAKTLYSLAARNRLPGGSVLRIGRQIRLNIPMIEAGAALSNRGRGRRGENRIIPQTAKTY